jgi:hypothetical protein
MNFHEWYKFGTPEEQNCFMGDAEKGWDACREEVLKLIKEYTYKGESWSGSEYDCITNIEDLTKDIEKL